MTEFLEQGSEQWFQARAECAMTGSEVGAALGLCPFTSRYALYKRKTSGVHDLPTNVAMQYGTEHEDEACADFAYAAGVSIRKTGLWKLSPYGDADKYQLGSSPDRLVVDESGRTVAVLEMKCKYSGILPDEPQLHHIPQCMLEMEAVGVDLCYLCYWTSRHNPYEDFSRKELVYYEIRRNKEFGIVMGLIYRDLRVFLDHVYKGWHLERVIPRGLKDRYRQWFSTLCIE